jgi:hypothetical protein
MHRRANSSRRALTFLAVAVACSAGTELGAVAAADAPRQRIVIALYRSTAQAALEVRRIVEAPGSLPDGVAAYTAVKKDRFGELSVGPKGEDPEAPLARRIVATLVAIVAGPIGYAARVPGADRPELLTGDDVGLKPQDLHDIENFVEPGRSAAFFVLDGTRAAADVVQRLRRSQPLWLFEHALPGGSDAARSGTGHSQRPIDSANAR